MTSQTNSAASPFELSGRVAPVTGGASGMGRAIAVRPREAGAQVVAVDRNPETARILKEFDPEGVATVVADLSEPHVHADILERAAEPFGPPTIVVNDAGIYPTSPCSTPRRSSSTWSMRPTNPRGLALMSITFARPLVATETPGSIINIASVDRLKPSLASGLAPTPQPRAG